MAAAEPLLRVEGLQVRYGPALALANVSLALRTGDVVAVLGANGAGKSTLARTVSGLVPAGRGTITFDGKDITRWPAYRVRRGGIVYLPEGRGIFPALTVTENIQIAADLLPLAARRSMRPWSCSPTWRPGARPGPGCCPAASSRCCRSPAAWSPVPS